MYGHYLRSSVQFGDFLTLFPWILVHRLLLAVAVIAQNLSTVVLAHPWASPHLQLWALASCELAELGLHGWHSDLLGFSARSASVSMAGDFGDCELSTVGLHFPASQQSYRDKNCFKRCLISTLLRNSKNISDKKLSLLLPIKGTDKLIKSNFPPFLCVQTWENSVTVLYAAC